MHCDYFPSACLGKTFVDVVALLPSASHYRISKGLQSCSCFVWYTSQFSITFPTKITTARNASPQPQNDHSGFVKTLSELALQWKGRKGKLLALTSQQDQRKETSTVSSPSPDRAGAWAGHGAHGRAWQEGEERCLPCC